MSMYQRKLIKYLIIGALFFIVLLVFSIRAKKIEKGNQFSGIVESIQYGDKGTPKVVIKNNAYFLSSTSLNFNTDIKPGDSLIKERNSLTYKLIKYKTNEVILSN